MGAHPGGPPMVLLLRQAWHILDDRVVDEIAFDPDIAKVVIAERCKDVRKAAAPPLKADLSHHAREEV